MTESQNEIGAIITLVLLLILALIGLQSLFDLATNRTKRKAATIPTNDALIRMLEFPSPVKRVQDAKDTLTEINKWAKSGDIKQEAARWAILADYAVSMSSEKVLDDTVSKERERFNESLRTGRLGPLGPVDTATGRAAKISTVLDRGCPIG